VTSIPSDYQWKYPASLESVNLICAAAAGVLDLYLVSGGDRFALLLLMREGLNNAVIHGCGARASLDVLCKLTVLAEEISIEVTDAGKGFDWRSAMHAPPEAASEGGRGMFIYAHYANSITFNEAGNCVIFTRKIEGGVYARNPYQP
jgi:anti-sigma regulatory factor (Ser/Thr protein kinase)